MEFVLNNYAEDVLNQEIKYFKKKIEVSTSKAKKRKRLKSTLDYFESDDVFVLPEISFVKGDEIVENMRRCLRLVDTLSKQQLIFTEFYLQTLYHFIYGDTFYDNVERIKTENDLDRIVQYALITVQRRQGKTVLTAWFVCCALLCIPFFTCAVFSPVRRQSWYFTDIIKDMLKLKGPLTGIDYKVVEENRETLSLLIDGSKRTVRGLPAVESRTRGTTAVLSIAEEAAQLQKKFFVSTILPIASETKNAFVGITTLVGTRLGVTNWVTKLMNSRDKRRAKHFLTYTQSAACDKCIASGDEETCRHKASELPPWHSPEKMSFTKEIMVVLDERDLMLQETLNRLTDDTVEAFPVGMINRALNKRNTTVEFTEIRDKPKILFVMIDPAGGSDASQLAMVSGFIDDRGQYVIIGMESVPGKYSSDFMPHLINHLLAIRRHEFYKNAAMVILIENNSALACNDITAMIKNTDHMELKHNMKFINKSSYDISHITMFGNRKHGSGKETNGLRTGADIKRAMMLKTRETLQLHRICFMKDLVTVYKVKEDKPDSLADAKVRLLQLLKAQLTAWAIIKKPKATVKHPDFDGVEWTLGGKHAGAPDDLATMLQLFIFWVYVYYTNAAFQDEFL